MKVLLDENMPHQLREYFGEHETTTAAYLGWSGWKNGALLKAAEDAGFDVIVTGDLSLEYQQNISVRKIAIVSLSAHNWRIIKNHLAIIVAAVAGAQPGTLTRVDCGRFVRGTKKLKGPLPG